MKTDPIPFPRGVSQPATRALNGAGYFVLSDLHGVSRSALLSLHGFGPKALLVLEPALAEHSWALAE